MKNIFVNHWRNSAAGAGNRPASKGGIPDPARCAHLVIDVQTCFCSPEIYEHTHGFDKISNATSVQTVKRLKSFLRETRHVLCPHWVLSENDGIHASPFLPKSINRSLYGVRAGWPEPKTWKRGGSAFYKTGLHRKLRRCGVDTVLLSGFYTNWCIRATALDSLRLGFRTIIMDDLTNNYPAYRYREHEIYDMLRAEGAETMPSALIFAAILNRQAKRREGEELSFLACSA